MCFKEFFKLKKWDKAERCKTILILKNTYVHATTFYEIWKKKKQKTYKFFNISKPLLVHLYKNWEIKKKKWKRDWEKFPKPLIANKFVPSKVRVGRMPYTCICWVVVSTVRLKLSFFRYTLHIIIVTVCFWPFSWNEFWKYD